MTTVALDRFTPGRAFARFEDDADTVSYTHLTLPTTSP